MSLQDIFLLKHWYCNISVYFLTEVPDPPSQPVVKEVYKDTALIAWNPPESDGGQPVTNYVVERKETLGKRWARCGTERIPSLEYKVSDLLPGCEYEFRVSAENSVGVGDPSIPSKPAFARDPIGM